MTSDEREFSEQSGAWSFVHEDKFYVCRAQRKDVYGSDYALPLIRYDFSSARWSSTPSICVVDEEDNEPFWRGMVGVGVCCAVLGSSVYIFGGLLRDGMYGDAVHQLDLETMVWRKLMPKNREDGPMRKCRAGMVAYGVGTLCVFGGHGLDTGRHQPGATYDTESESYLSQVLRTWTNELHIFHPKKHAMGTWSSPETTGLRPPPCAGFSFTKVDLFRVVLLGGEGKCCMLNGVYILDMENWHWSGAILPSGLSDLSLGTTSLHSACALRDPVTLSSTKVTSTHHLRSCSATNDTCSGHLQQELFVLYGRGSLDAWILDINNIAWKQVKIPSVLRQPLRNFCLGCYNRSPTEAELVVFRGLQHEELQSRRHTDRQQGLQHLLFLQRQLPRPLFPRRLPHLAPHQRVLQHPAAGFQQRALQNPGLQQGGLQHQHGQLQRQYGQHQHGGLQHGGFQHVGVSRAFPRNVDNLKATSDTTLLHLGIRSLYHLCVDEIAGRYEFIDSLLQQLLPPHIWNDIIQQRKKQMSITYWGYQLAQL